MRRRSFGTIRQLPSSRCQVRHLAEGSRRLAPMTFADKPSAVRWPSRREADAPHGAWRDGVGLNEPLAPRMSRRRP